MLQSILAIVFSIIPFLFVLGMVVTIHELGHFLAAKWCGVAIERFSIGFGKALLSWHDRSGVEWRLAWIPLGGYVKFAGDDNAASVPSAEDLDELRRQALAIDGPQALKNYFHFKPLWQRAIVVAAGPIANFVLSTTLFALLLGVFGEPILPARVDVLQPGLPAALSGFKVGDIVEKANDETIDSFSSLAQYVAYRGGSLIRFQVRRGDQDITILATPALREQRTLIGTQKVGALGIQENERPNDLRIRHYNPIEAIGGGAAQTWDMIKTTVFIIGRLLQGQLPAGQLSGPLGIAQMSGAVVHAGAAGAANLGAAIVGVMTNLASLVAIVSVSVGFMNLLPVPVLDGGHLLFYAYEAAARRPLAARVQAAGYRVGLALLLGLMLFATWNDLQRLRVFQFLGGLFS